MAMDIIKAQIIDYVRSGIKVNEIDLLLKQLCVYIENFKYLKLIQLAFAAKVYSSQTLCH